MIGSCTSYLSRSVLADRIEVFSIYANHSHKHGITTALCQESSPSAQSLHSFLWRYLQLSTTHLNIPPFSIFSFIPPYVTSMDDMLFCKSNETARVWTSDGRTRTRGQAQSRLIIDDWSSWVAGWEKSTLGVHKKWIYYREMSRFCVKGSSSSSGVISLIHSGRCANILPKISWKHTGYSHTHSGKVLSQPQAMLSLIQLLSWLPVVETISGSWPVVGRVEYVSLTLRTDYSKCVSHVWYVTFAQL